MNRPLVLALFAVVLLLPPASPAAETPQLDFVRGLRERGYPDLALEYLQKIAAKPPAEIAPLLPLEMARCRLDLAKSIPDLTLRQQQYTDARAEFQTFLDKNPDSPLAATARFDIAQVTVLLGRVQLTRMQQEGNAEAKNKLGLGARALLVDAGKALEAVGKTLETQLAKLENAATPEEKAQKKALTDARYQAELELGLVYLNQAETYTDPENNAENARARVDVVEKASKVFSTLMARDVTHPVCWLARAQFGRCKNEAGTPDDARAVWALIINDTTKASDQAKRFARFYRIEVAGTSPKAGEDRLKMAEEWIKLYPTYLNTNEGSGVRFALANLKAGKALDPKTPAATKTTLLNEAKLLCQTLERYENEYRPAAFRLKIQIIATEGGFKQKVADLKTFDDCYVRARYEADVLSTKLKENKDPAKAADIRKEQFAAVIDALKRALDFAKNARPPQKIPPEDINEARSMLAFAYFTQGELEKTIATGEELAYARPRNNQSVNGALYALQAYAQMLDEKKGDEKEVKENLRKLATFMKQTWSEDQTGDTARHRLGALLYKEGKFKEAYEELAAVKPSYSEAILSNFLLAMSAQSIQLEVDKENPNNDRAWEHKAMTALEKMPALPPNPDPVLTHTYVQGKLALGERLFRQKKFVEVDGAITPLLKILDTAKLSDEVKDDLKTKATNQAILAKYVQADTEFKAGQFAKVDAILAPVMDQLKAGQLAELKKNPPLQWGVLGLALRSQIQEGKLAEAQEILKTIQKLSEEGDFAAGGTNTMASIIQLLVDQVGELRRKGDTDKLTRTKGALALFLDNLAKQKEQTPEIALLLTSSYINVDEPKKAVEITRAWLDKMKEKVPPLPAKNQPASKERSQWEAMYVFHIRALRLDKQLEEARKEMDATFAKVGNEPGWGNRNLEARKENCHLFGAEGKWSSAVLGWDQLIKQLQKFKDDAKLKEHYFESYFNLVNAMSQAALKLEGAKKEGAFKSAAKLIVDLENTVPDMGGKTSKDRFDDLLKSIPELRAEYDQLKKSVTAPK